MNVPKSQNISKFLQMIKVICLNVQILKGFETFVELPIDIHRQTVRNHRRIDRRKTNRKPWNVSCVNPRHDALTATKLIE
jgi:hypothetical protein